VTLPRTGIVRHEKYKEHLAGYSHVESPKRLEVIYSMLDEADMAGKFEAISPRPATGDELCWVHSESHVKRIAGTDGKPCLSLDPDTQTTSQSYQAARLAVGGLLALTDKIYDGTVQNGFALVRPPGHHAERDRAMGFCLFNNVACGALYAQKIHEAERVLIVDWDLHHGNATQNSFYENPNVLYFSTHQYPYYPGSGALTEVGRKDGSGYTVNVPLRTGYGDGDFYHIFKAILGPVADGFKPDFILVSAGFDTYYEDPLGGMRVTPKGYAALTRMMMGFADTHCSGKLAFTLEGGYHLAGLRESVKAVLKELSRDSMLTDDHLASLDKTNPPPVIKEVIEIQKKYWPQLKGELTT
jgi:acetoin utilization deacetylase AcuC-like enzyme